MLNVNAGRMPFDMIFNTPIHSRTVTKCTGGKLALSNTLVVFMNLYKEVLLGTVG